ncbi:MAG: glycoside hydrolase family 9 protein [Spirochaetaceae bacterium]
MRILVNHLGYDLHGPKRAILREEHPSDRPPTHRVSEEDSGGLSFLVRAEPEGEVVHEGEADYLGAVERWKQGVFWSLDFSALRSTGFCVLEVRNGGELLARSSTFEIREHLLFEETFSNTLFWLKGQRSSGAEDMADRSASFFGDRRGTVDLHGGWFDASGDNSKYLSHLSYANYLNPQQTPGVVWALLAARELLAPLSPGAPALWERRLLDEAGWGADFLLRMQDPEGYFYVTLFDRWSKDLDARIVSSFRTQEGHRGDEYQAAYRQGGGMAIAALARAGAVALGLSVSSSESNSSSAPADLPGAPGRGKKPPETLLPGAFAPKEYLAAARRGFLHLEEHNLAYLDDGEENCIDDYCALLAAVELYLAAVAGGWDGAEDAPTYLAAARGRADSLRRRLATDEEGRRFWRAGTGARPYYHAAEAGLPVLALLRYAECEAVAGDPSRREAALATAAEAVAAELAVTGEVNNPFGYARQHVAEPGGAKRTSFFIPHNNESGYWWQGENARIASLAAAALLAAAGPVSAEGASGRAVRGTQLVSYATDQLNWILGLNPLDMSMLDGVGRNNPEYEAAFPNTPGGICNGITAGVEDEGDIAFLPTPWGSDPLHRWRWSEQWIPHVGWYILAVSALRAYRY